MNLVRARSWGQVKPPSGAQVDWGHPLANGLGICVLLNEQSGIPRDLVSGARGGPDTGIDAGPSPHDGGAIRHVHNGTGGSYNFGSAIPDSLFIQSAGCSVISRVRHSAIAIDEAIVVKGSGGKPIEIYFPNGNQTNLSSARSDGISNVVVTTTSGGYPSDGVRPSVVAVTYADNLTSTTPRFYADGVRQTSGTSPSGGVPSTTGASLYAAGGSGVFSSLQGTMSYLFVWKRQLSPDEVAWQAAEPYSFIAPPSPKILYIGFKGPTPDPGNSVTGGSLKLHSS